MMSEGMASDTPYSIGADIRQTLAAQHAKRVQEELMELALQEDQLLLMTIKSTLENPKYGF